MAEGTVELDGREEGRGREGGVKLFCLPRIAREIEGGLNGGNDFWCDFEKVEREMDTLPFIKQMLSQPVLRVLLSDTSPLNPDFHFGDLMYLWKELREVDVLNDKDRNVKVLQQCSRYAGFIRRQQIDQSSRRNNRPSFLMDRMSQRHLAIIKGNIDEMVLRNYFNQTKEDELEHKDKDPVINSLDHKADSSNCLTNKEKSRALLLMTAFPDLREIKEPHKILEFLLVLFMELDNLPEMICKACEEQHLAVFLIGRLLSFKPRAYNTLKRVKDDLVKIKEFDINGATNNHMRHIFTYCYNDLPYLLQSCFLYLACYPINYEIHARSLIELWIAEAFITPEEGDTIEETAYKYLEQLAQRSLVCISKRSFSGAIKYFRVLDSIHEFVIQQSCTERFLVPNPNPENMNMYRLALHSNNKKYELFGNTEVHSILAFNFDRIVLRDAMALEVLELRKSVVPKLNVDDFPNLVYLGLRGSDITELHKNIGFLTFLQTLDVRDTRIQILPKSLWEIPTLRHVYVNPNPQIKGPPSTANISDLQILKTVVVHESWVENFPQCLINLRKLALSNRDNNPDWKSNPYWKSISILLGHMVNLLSMRIISDIVPSELVDTRAFPNLKTVKSIKFEGKWTYRKLYIDNVTFPPNLTKLTLTKSGLKEDPMPRLERLQALKFLSLQDEAYTGTQMVCSANGFPQLQLLEFKKFENLESLEAKPMAMPQLTQVRVDRCPKLKLNFHSRTFSSEVLESIKNEETGTTGIESGLNLFRTDRDQPGPSAEYYEPGPNIDLDLH